GLVCIKPSADIRRSSIAAIAAGARDADPIRAAGNLRRVLSRLIERALVANNLGFIGDALRVPNLRDWQFARYRLEALLYCRELRLECALHPLLGSFEFLTRGLAFLRDHHVHSLDDVAVRDTALAPVASRLPFLKPRGDLRDLPIDRRLLLKLALKVGDVLF